MKRLMLDTNILISGIVFYGSERNLIRACYLRRYTMVLSEYIIRETQAVLKRKFPERESLLPDLLDMLEVEIASMPTTPMVEAAKLMIRDPNDAVILASAIESRPDVFVSGDLDFHTKKIGTVINVMTTREALNLIESL